MRLRKIDMYPLYQRSNRRATALRRLLLMLLLMIMIDFVRPVAGAEDASIDRLLKRLPEPEKLVRPQDPAGTDALARKALDALNANNYGRALDYSRKLTRAHPRSAVAHGLHGWIALGMRQVREASTEFHTAVQTQPDYSFGYFGLGLCELTQNRYAKALQNFQQLARLEPKAEIAWIGSSECAEGLGRRAESLAYARRATTLAPRSAMAWVRLGRAEEINGHKTEAQRAYTRARELGQQRSTSTKSKRR